MSNQRGKFAKRQREMDLKDKARAKQERRAAKRTEVRATKGPEIAWDEAVHAVISEEEAPAEAVEEEASAASGGALAGRAAHAADVPAAGAPGSDGRPGAQAGAPVDPGARRRP